MLLHWPSNFDLKALKPPCAAESWRYCRKEAWKGLERAYKEGQAGVLSLNQPKSRLDSQVKALGVSNFALRHLKELLADGPELPVAVNQARLSH